MCKIDFGIVTVLGIERKAINGRLEGVKTIPGDPPDIREYYRGRLTLADGTAYELAVVQCNQAGNSDAGQAAKDLLLRWSPNYLIMLGVTGGIPRGNLKIGDVVVATEVVVYDYRRFFNHNWDPRPRHHTTDAGLLTKVLAAPDWDGHDVPPPCQNPEAWKPALQKPGPIAVGNALFADERARDRLLKMQQDLIAIEMESEGVAVAAWQRRPPTPLFVIRSICDLANTATKALESENGEEFSRFHKEKIKEKRQETAAHAAASFLVHLLSTCPVRPQKIISANRNQDVKPQAVGVRVGSKNITVRADEEPLNTAKNISIPEGYVRHNARDGSILVYIDSGVFTMGTASAVLAAGDFVENTNVFPECVPHLVTIKGFWIGKFPITNAQYRKFVEQTGHRPPERWDNRDFNKPNHPVIGVNWHDAQTYLEWAGLRLPTEAEWEYVACGPDPQKRIFPWGNTVATPDMLSFTRQNYGTTPVSVYVKGATPVTEILDMAGNVLEWCLDDALEYAPHPVENPLGNTKSEYHVIRGGSFARQANECRAAYRDRRRCTATWGSTGFRPAFGGAF